MAWETAHHTVPGRLPPGSSVPSWASTKGLPACPAPGKGAPHTAQWERGCTLPAQAAPRAAGSLSAAESRLQQCWELLVPPGYFPASSNIFLND